MFSSNKDQIKNSQDLLKTISKDTSIPSIIGNAAFIEGSIVSKGAVEIAGRFKGDIEAVNVTIRSGATFEGNINSQYLQVYGFINGKIEVAVLHAMSGCTIKADVSYGIIHTEEKAIIMGSFVQNPGRLNLKEQHTLKSKEAEILQMPSPQKRHTDAEQQQGAK